ncbi:MAG: hypothetical protein HY811_10790 [Planctomycetes bacterium]|nr:hypothetical protein [Planctomycetota bacterium]
MKNRFGAYIYLLLAILALILPDCAGTKGSSSVETSGIKQSFNKFSDAMVKGELETAYNLLSSSYKMAQPFDDFCAEYNENKEFLVIQYKNASLTTVAIEGNNATARVRWGTGEDQVLDFLNENDTWKISRKSQRRIRTTR